MVRSTIKYQLTTQTQRKKTELWGQGKVTDPVTHEKRLEIEIKSRVGFKTALLSKSKIEGLP